MALSLGFIYLAARLARLARQWMTATEPNEPARLVDG